MVGIIRILFAAFAWTLALSSSQAVSNMTGQDTVDLSDGTPTGIAATCYNSCHGIDYSRATSAIIWYCDNFAGVGIGTGAVGH